MLPKWCRLAGLLICITVLAGFWGVATAEAALIGTKEEIDIGRKVANDLEKKYGLAEDAELQARVAKIGANLVAVSERKDLPYTFKVLKSKEVNALALPGGFIYVFQGLIDYMPSDEELAGVLGHELGHVVKRHTVRQMEKSLTMGILFGLIFGDRGVFLQNLAYNALMAGYSREDEREADRLGFVHSYKAGYNPYSMLLAMQKLADMENKPSYGLFSSHPEPDTRAALLKKQITQAGVYPQAIIEGETARVAQGEWTLPTFRVSYDNYKPFYRAYFAAGALYRAAQTPNFSPDRFVLNDIGPVIHIYYEDRWITTLSESDAAAAQMELINLAGLYLDNLRQWSGRLQ